MGPKLHRCNSDHGMYDATLINFAKVLTSEHTSKSKRRNERSIDYRKSSEGDLRSPGTVRGATISRKQFQRRNSSFANATSLEEFLSWGMPPEKIKGVPCRSKSFHAGDDKSLQPKSILRTSSYLVETDAYGKGKNKNRSFGNSMPNLGVEDYSACESTDDDSFDKPASLRRSSSSVSFSDMSELFLFPDEGSFPDEEDILDFLSGDLTPQSGRKNFLDVPEDENNGNRVDTQSAEKTNQHHQNQVASQHLVGIVNLKWTTPGTNISGFYSGTINTSVRPHGKGKIMSSKDPSDVIYGEWNDGKLVRECDCDDRFLSEIPDGVKDQWNKETKKTASQREVSQDRARADYNRTKNSLVEDFLFFDGEEGRDDFGFGESFFRRKRTQNALKHMSRNDKGQQDNHSALNVAIKQRTSSLREDCKSPSNGFGRGSHDALPSSPMTPSRKVSNTETSRSNRKTQSRRHSTGEFLNYDGNGTVSPRSMYSNLKEVPKKKTSESMKSKSKLYDFAQEDSTRSANEGIRMETTSNNLHGIQHPQQWEEKKQLVGIINLKWTDPGTQICGFYSGTINSAGRPHGKGKFSVNEDDLVATYGEWDDGNLVKKCVCDEQFLSRIHAGVKTHWKHDNTNTNRNTRSSSFYEERFVWSTKSCHTSRTNISPKNVSPPNLPMRLSRRSSSGDKNNNNRKIQSRRHSAGEFLNFDCNETLSPRSVNSSSRPILTKNKNERFGQKNKPLDYVLGEPARSPNDMIICSTAAESMESISNLKLHDFAFIRRSNGQWTYAIVANRDDNFAGKAGDDDVNEVMLFVIDEKGTTKRYWKRHWKSHIRRVRT
ncbi:hypothetical protein ACHAXS_006919 [Conticribra weissflogii]